MRLGARVVLVAIVCVAAALPAVTATSQTAVDLSGGWSWSNTSNQTNTYTGPVTIQHNVGAGTFTITMNISGPDSSSTVTGNGTVSGTQIQIQTDPYGSTTNNQTYTAQYQGTISENGTRLQGTWQQSDGQDGTFVATKTSSPTPTPTPTPSETGNADLCVKLVAQRFDRSSFAEHDSCNASIAGTHELIWHRAFPLLVQVTNRGPDPAEDVRARIVLPAGLNFSPRTNEGICGEGGRQRTCRYGTLASGETAEKRDQLVVAGEGTLEPRSVEIVVTVTTTTPESTPLDNEASVSTTLLPGGADLEVRAGGPERADGSSLATYRAVLVNNGPEVARTVQFSGRFRFGTGVLRTVRSMDPSRAGCEDYTSGFVCRFRRVATGRAGEVLVIIKVTVPGVGNGRRISFEVDGLSNTPDPDRNNDHDVQRTSIR
jgi:hypothetical protein